MPTLPAKALERRDASPGRTFSIVFAVVAVLVVLGCLILVILLPRFRKKPRAIPGSRYPVVPNHPHPFGPPPRFPSHPALLRGFRKKFPVTVQQYDPRIESPFPSSTTQLTANRPAQYAIHSNGLFTPPQCCFPINSRQSDTNDPRYIMRAVEPLRPDPRQFTTFSAKHEYILPVPEPLLLKPRPAGRPPPLTRQLERFPMPLPLTSIRNRGLIHPAKLFKELEQRNSDATTESFGTPCPVPQSSKHATAIGISVNESEFRFEEAAANISHESCKEEHEKSTNQEAPSTPRKLQSHTKDSHCIGVKADSQKPPARLERMGTLTRPKTPVAEICNRFDRAARDANKEQSSSSKRLYTPASNPFTTPGLSSTPPTSPGSAAKRTPRPSTPSKQRAASFCVDVPAHRRTPSSVMLPSAEKFTALPLASPAKCTRRAAGAPPQEKVFKKGRLKLVSWSKLRSNVRASRRYSSSSLSTIFKPILGPQSQHSHGASSVYSRDARGMSFLEAMDLPLKGAANPHIEASRSATLPAGRETGMLHKQSASTDYLKTKIDNWDLHIGTFERYSSPSSTVKRSASDIGPRRAETQASAVRQKDVSTQARFIPLIQIGRSSDDVFGIEADGFRSDQSSVLMKRMGRVGMSPVVVGKLGRGTAPGGAEWV
ncbi:hypothetical protein H2200_008532 [Cladophialophora chaetospira]|uniref:Uncharacterized protein n=1 Tax=Cladophialophora chaetospira TaxID=386627 RepID=A0AA38X621_9EURO|nr:hypothetical protein H2200_008532 [Cladophialophora chaetospira]